MTSASIYRDRLTKQRRDVLAMANDSTVDAGFRIEAHNLACEMDKMNYLLSFETPAMIAKELSGIHDRVKKIREWIESNNGSGDVRLVVNAKALPNDIELKGEQQQQQQQPQQQEQSKAT